MAATTFNKGRARTIAGGLEPSEADKTAIVPLTDSTGGTATDTLDDTTASVKDDLASLAAKIDEILNVLESAGLIKES